jgi:peptidoglycan hydrolase-like protein with peptidoglycan-binding domain
MPPALTADVLAAFDPGMHPHAPAGSPAGGQFAPSGGGGKSTSKPTPARRSPTHQQSGKPQHHTPIPKGQLGFDGSTGTGYGVKGGDSRVKQLQTDLNRLGLADGHGKKLSVDGKLGPLTTQAIKAAQTRLGMKPTGVITEGFIARLKATHALPKSTHTAPHKAAPKKTVKAASDTPYGPKSQVDYADPGYQSDGKARYPLDSEEHCRAAWSYINQADNAAKYAADQLARIKARIKTAGKKYGVTFADDVKAAAGPDLRDVELARPGAWKLSSGPVDFTEQMLRDAADFFTASGGQRVPVKLGHVDDRWDGEPSFGSVANVRYAEDGRGPVLLGDIVDMPGWLAASAPKRWPNRSIEGWRDFEYQGRTYSLVLSGLAFLGATPPAVLNIKSLADLQTALAASSALRLVASAPADDEATPPQTTAPEAEETTNEGTGMDPAKIREALGLPAEASDDEVRSALITAAGVAPQNTPPPEPVQVSLFDGGAGEAANPAPAKPAATVGAPGTIVLASSVWEATQDTIKRLTAFVDKTQRDERDQVIAKAVQDGKFTPAQRPHFAKLWDADPNGTRALIDNLTRNSALAVLASGYVDGNDEDFDAEYAHLFGPAKGASRG